MAIKLNKLNAPPINAAFVAEIKYNELMAKTVRVYANTKDAAMDGAEVLVGQKKRSYGITSDNKIVDFTSKTNLFGRTTSCRSVGKVTVIER